MRDTHDPVLPRGEDPGTGAAANHSSPAKPAAPMPAARRRSLGRFLVAMGKRLATLAIALVAILIAIVTWQTYVMGPWTRNGNVRVQVANVAPQVSGQIVELHVNDNQFVRQGDTLYTIDPFDFEVALRTSQAQVAQAAADGLLRLSLSGSG